MGLTTLKSQCTVFTRGKEFALSDLLDTSYRLVKTVCCVDYVLHSFQS